MNLVLNPNSQTPLYMQLYSQISTQILNGELPSGSQLPAIRVISNDFKISVIPVKMAWEELDKNGFIQTVSGKGTFVKNISQKQIIEKKEEKIEEFVNEILIKSKEKNIELNDLIEKLKLNLS